MLYKTLMEKKFYSKEGKEKEPQKIIVEIGPNDRPMVWRLERSKDEAKYKAGGETIFNIKPSNLFFEIDLLPDRSVDIFRHQIRKSEQEDSWVEKGRLKSHLKDIKDYIDEVLPQGVKTHVLHADAQKLPFGNEQVDILFMANVFGGHVKDDKLLGFEADAKRILREKQNLIKEAKRVLKGGGKLIIEEEYAPAKNVAFTLEKIIDDLKHDSDFSFRDLTDENGVWTMEITKR